MKRWLSYSPALIGSVILPLLSLANMQHLPDTSALHFSGLDKVLHLLMYAALTCCWLYPLPAARRSRPGIAAGVALGVALYGLLMELCQLVFTNYRSFDIRDALANLAGALIAAAGFYFYSTRSLARTSAGGDQRSTSPAVSPVAGEEPGQT